MLGGSTLTPQRLAFQDTAGEEGQHVAAAVFRKGHQLSPEVLAADAHTELGIQDDETSKDDT